MLRHRLSRASCIAALAFGCAYSTEEPLGSSDPSGSARVREEGCGGEAAQGGYIKDGGDWDGSAGNPYGYPAALRPPEDCYGFGFHDTCTFYESCIYSCEYDKDCPSVADSGSGPECRARVPSSTPGVAFTEQQICVLPCSPDSTSEHCPEGMDCVFHPYGFGDVCMWPR